jgi:predicted DNA-binding transcriptional regulator YafY
MTFQEHFQLLERIDRLISRRGTGKPHELAQRLNISDRSLYRLMDELRAFGFTIYYDAERCSYCYEGHNSFKLILGSEKKSS